MNTAFRLSSTDTPHLRPFDHLPVQHHESDPCAGLTTTTTTTTLDLGENYDGDGTGLRLPSLPKK